jgi:hypothetical protein
MLIWVGIVMVWWERFFLILIYGRSVVDRENLNFVHPPGPRGHRRPSYVTDGDGLRVDYLTSDQHWMFLLGYGVLALGIPSIVFYLGRIYFTKFRHRQNPGHENTRTHPKTLE